MIRLRLFGPIELRNGDDAELHAVLTHSKHVALLAYLLIGHQGLHRRDRLTALLWPDIDDVRGRNALSKALHHLRRALGDDVFVSRRDDDVGINASRVWCDVAAFEAAASAGSDAEALELFGRGELLDGFRLDNLGDFEHWLEVERQRLRLRATASAVALSDRAQRDGDMNGAAQWARVAADLAPHDEVVLRRVLTRLRDAGDDAGAVSAYQTFAALIARDLEAEPSSQTRDLARSLRRGSNESSAPVVDAANAPEELAAAPTTDDVAIVGVTPGPVVGSRRKRLIAMTAALLVAVLVAGIYSTRTRVHPGLIAVGALQNRTGDSTLDPLVGMATGAITQWVAQSGGGDVVDLRSLGAKTSQPVTLARSVGAEKVVTGDLYRRNDSLLVQLQIARVKDGRVLYSLEPVAAPLNGSSALVDRLRDGVAGALSALADTLYLPWSMAHSRAPKYAAFQEFMQGLDAIVSQGARPAVAHFKKAMELDHDFVEAKLWLLEQAVGLRDERKLVDSVAAAAFAQRGSLGPFDRASLDRQLAFLDGRLEDTYAASRRLVAFSPKTPDALLLLAQASMATQRYGEAIEVLHRMERSKGWMKDLGQIRDWDLQAHRLNGDAATAVAEWRRARAAAPSDFGVCTAGVMPLASLGHEAAVDQLIGECGAIPNAAPMMGRTHTIAGRAFRSGSHRDAARRAFRRALAVNSAAAPTANARRRAAGRLHSELGEWRAAYDSLLATVDTTDAADRTMLAVAAAHVGDTATVSETLRWIDLWAKREKARGGGQVVSRLDSRRGR